MRIGHDVGEERIGARLIEAEFDEAAVAWVDRQGLSTTGIDSGGSPILEQVGAVDVLGGEWGTYDVERYVAVGAGVDNPNTGQLTDGRF